MRSIRTILVAVDFSGPSERAVEVAIDFAGRFGALLHVFHAYKPRASTIDGSDAPAVCALNRGLRRAAAKSVDEIVTRAQESGIKASGEVAEGPPSWAIREEVDRLKPDLLIMGTHGRSGLKHVVLGSVAERTIRSVTCPVVTVHDDAT